MLKQLFKGDRRIQKKTHRILAAAVVFFLLSCSPRASVQQQVEKNEATSGTGEAVGPPEPTAFVGPVPQSSPEMTVIIGPGMASALSGAGVLRAVHGKKIKVRSVGGTEFGAYISSAFALTGSLNRMDWVLLQFKRDWAAPLGAAASFFQSKRRSTEQLHSGLKKIFQTNEIPAAAVENELFGMRTAREMVRYRSGRVADVLCELISGRPWMDSCDFSQRTHEKPPFKEEAVSSLGNASGLRAPILWVVPARASGTIASQAKEELPVTQSIDHAIALFEKLVTEAMGPNDLIVRPKTVLGNYFDFERRSEVIYSGQEAASQALEAWLKGKEASEMKDAL